MAAAALIFAAGIAVVQLLSQAPTAAQQQGAQLKKENISSQKATGANIDDTFAAFGAATVSKGTTMPTSFEQKRVAISDSMPPEAVLPAGQAVPAQIIRQARDLDKRMAEANRPKPIAQALKDPLITKAEVEETRAALRRISAHAPEFAEALQLLATLDRREEEGKQAMAAAIAKTRADDVQGRQAYAKQLERNYLEAGFDLTVSISGPKATTLSLRYVLMN